MTIPILEPLGHLSDHPTPDFCSHGPSKDPNTAAEIRDTPAQNTSDESVPLKPSFVAQKANLGHHFSSQLDALLEFVQTCKFKIESLDEAKVNVQKELNGLEERIKSHKYISGVADADGTVEGKN